MMQPAIFIGHGSPLNIIADNAFTRELKNWGKNLEKNNPSGILAISAHWRSRGPSVTMQEHPPTIHDFSGFPLELAQVTYPARGSSELVRRVQELIPEVAAVSTWGLDHGSWSLLIHLFPSAKIPVVQLSLDKSKLAPEHWELATKLKPLREEGILILGSGNIVHSFEGINDPEDAPPHPLGIEFASSIKNAICETDTHLLCHYKELGASAKFAAPSSEHYLPLLYPLAVRMPDDPIAFHCDLFQHGTISHLSFQVG